MNATTKAKIIVKYQKPNTKDKTPRTAGITINGMLSRANFKILLLPNNLSCEKGTCT